MAKDVKKFVKRCPTCAFNKMGPHHGQMHIPPNGSKPWQVVSVDVVDLDDTAAGNREAVIFTDRFSRAVRAFPVPRELSSELFLNIVAFGLIPDVGTPSIMISDRGSNLTSRLCKEFYKEFGVEPRLADAHMHTAVGATERFNTTLREMARAAYFDTKCEWDLFLPYLVMFYNATVQASTGYSPYFIEHGREPTLPWHPQREPPSNETGSLEDYVHKHLLGLHLAWDSLMANLDDVERRRKMHHDAKYQTNIVFAPGDRVLLLQPGRRSKMEMPYVGPYRVVWGPDERDRYGLRDLEGRRFNEFHVSKLKEWPSGVEGIEDIGDDYYIVERILDVRMREGEKECLVKWTGYSKKHNSWENWKELSEAAKEEATRLEKEKELGSAADVGMSSTNDVTQLQGNESDDDEKKKKKKKKKKRGGEGDDGGATAPPDGHPTESSKGVGVSSIHHVFPDDLSTYVRFADRPSSRKAPATRH